MGRNYIKETAWSNERYKRYHVKLRKDDAEKMQILLDRLNTNFSQWVRDSMQREYSKIDDDQG